MSGCDAPAGGERDLVRRRAALLLWCLPTALIIVGAAWSEIRVALWIPSFLVMGTACLFNARRCGRLHCHLTGPLFILAALATALDAASLVHVAWPWILLVAGAGTALGYGLEHLRGVYVPR